MAAVVVLVAACAGGTDAAAGDQSVATSVVSASVDATPTLLTAVTTSALPTSSTAAPMPSSSAPETVAVTTTAWPTTVAATATASPTTVAVTTTAVTATSTTATLASTVAGTISSTDPVLAIGPRTSCRQVVHIGDSTSEHLWAGDSVGGDPNATMEARYHAIGVEDVHNDSSGGRSMVERINRQQRNAIEVAEEVRAAGFHGCWVLMIGTNDAANVAAGANVGLAARIESMLAIIGDDPVLWVNAASSSSIAWYGDDSMQAFNAALADAATRHANLWVFDWWAAVQADWYGPDGLHPNQTGRAWRSALTAQELAFAFPG